MFLFLKLCLLNKDTFWLCLELLIHCCLSTLCGYFYQLYSFVYRHWQNIFIVFRLYSCTYYQNDVLILQCLKTLLCVCWRDWKVFNQGKHGKCCLSNHRIQPTLVTSPKKIPYKVNLLVEKSLNGVLNNTSSHNTRVFDISHIICS